MPLESWYDRPKTRKTIATQVTDHDGRVCDVGTCRRGGVPQITCDGNPEYLFPAPEPDPDSVREWLAERKKEKIAEYIASGRFTEREIFTIRAIWLQKLSMRRVAQLEGVSPQAIRERIEGNGRGHGGIMRKAVEFAAWWACKNRMRRRTPRRSSK